jgi:putative ABC transport system permease protein
MIGVGTDTLRSLAIIIAIVSALSIFISLYRSMKERKYELALLRVMGASRVNIFMLIILEGLILASIGYIFGALISHLSMEWMAGYLKSDFRYNFTGWVFLNEEWILFGVSLIIGFIASIIPAIQSARSDIHKILSEK